MNDGAVMTGWAKDQGTAGSMLKLLGDPSSEFTKALGLVFDDPKAMEVLGNPRCKRFSMFVDNGIIRTLTVAQGDVPAEDTFVDKVLEEIKKRSMLEEMAAGVAAASPPSSKAAASAFVAQPPKLSLASHQGLPQHRKAYPSLPSQPLGAYRNLPGSLPNRPVASQRALGPRLDEESSPATLFDVLIAGMIGFLVGAGVTFAVFPSRRGHLIMQKPLLAA